MEKVIRTVLLPYSAEQMFKIINDVARYPEFLAWCDSTNVISESAYEMIAAVTIAKAGIKQMFKTRNQLIQGKRIEMHLIEGPFKSLHGVWEFEDQPEGGCEVRFGVKFEAMSSLLNVAIAPIFSGFANSMIDSLGERAKVVYGAPA